MAVKPKLAMIPSGVGVDKLYSVLPSDGTGDFTFDRNLNTATRINKDGLIEMVDADVPRLNYPLIDGVVSGCPSLLLEPARTNLVSYSEDFTQSAWVKLGQGSGSVPIVTPNYAISPDGTQNASRLQCDLNGGNTTSDRSWLYQTITNISGENTFSLYVKNNSNEEITFALSNGSAETVVVLSDNKWHRLSTVKSGGGQPRIGLIGGLGASDNADLLIWGAQLEQGSYPTSYIPNLSTGSTTRSAETCNNAGDVNTFNDSEGVLFAEIANIKNDDGVEKRLSIQDSGTFDEVRITFTASTNEIVGVVYNNSSNQCDLIHIVNNTEDFNKIALKYKENDFALWVNGIEVATDNSGSVFNSGSLDELSYDLNNNYKVYGSTKQIQYFDNALTDADLEQLTSWKSFNEMATAQQYSIL